MITFNYQGRQLQGWKVESINTARGDGTDTLYYAEADALLGPPGRRPRCDCQRAATAATGRE